MLGTELINVRVSRSNVCTFRRGPVMRRWYTPAAGTMARATAEEGVSFGSEGVYV
jgi:hypothetical protein